VSVSDSSFKYSIFAVNPEPQEEQVNITSYAEGYIYDNPKVRVRKDLEMTGPSLVIDHFRNHVDVSKVVEAVDYNDTDVYRIHLTAENFGNSPISFKLKDLIQISRALKIEPFIECHSKSDLEKIPFDEVKIVGINSRDLAGNLERW